MFEKCYLGTTCLVICAGSNIELHHTVLSVRKGLMKCFLENAIQRVSIPFVEEYFRKFAKNWKLSREDKNRTSRLNHQQNWL